MREFESAFDAAGITVRFVVIGSPELAREFCSRFGDPARCLSDEQKTTYRAMGLQDYNLWGIFTDRPLRERRRQNKAAGFSQNWRATRMENAAQLPGAALFDRDGKIRWLHRGVHPGDIPPMSEMYERASAILQG